MSGRLRLEAKAREMETFTYSVSHDLKAPLRGIDGYSRLLLEDHLNQLDEEGRTFLRNIQHATEQMGQLINDLLAYSRLERRELRATAGKFTSTDQVACGGLHERSSNAGRRHKSRCAQYPRHD